MKALALAGKTGADGGLLPWKTRKLCAWRRLNPSKGF